MNNFNKLKNKKILVAVSGGPDSMFLLFQCIQHNLDIEVAFVNYNQREDSWKDEQIVSDFTSINNIKLHKLILKKSDYIKNNFQDWARKQRYLFFSKIYKEINADFLLVAHHKDDLIETYFLNKKQNKIKFSIGIKQSNHIYGMNVYRPFLYKFFKNKIEKLCIKHKVKYATDYTNKLTKYERNKIRLKFANCPNFVKNIIVLHINMKQKLYHRKENKVNKLYIIWKEAIFDQDIFKKLKYKERLIYKFVNDNYDDINLSKMKIKSIIDFVISNNRTKKYKLKNNIFITKIKGKLYLN
ncbi:tRNA lysidine(34) synthetase TilS [Mycoplasma anatis]|uniref:tRNA lysidine(34) synthetase TilS n=1 Tax=Mycoplasmopsis anatis TaxID=171279 RepID=UPI001C4DDF78|nr:tRNA lysidine(34) synthetase TilS [Mycoplasmopsis anatis]MBW0596039.1 tRNA lysidine(34) synthetase TilS [Mycoplasmopsis anatis]MBW0597443.1 tRNA lysidine(34) synthetase TilS [Mycoplasmopsis anatis]MBW0599769.1 tRNA lysidine(34) synthetase TilS [Mycoplasmopsis anatis]MBW0600397.1 tRNA lysidine(34) synthetase TilS [Mycoplasmopsis anatis]